MLHIFGPAYKGIPLVVSTAIALGTKHKRDVPYTFNRKTAKDHGEGGVLVGASLRGKKVVIVDDVITAGTAIREAVDLVKNEDCEVVGVLVALDRQEVAPGAGEGLSAIQQVGGPARLGTEVGGEVVVLVAIGDGGGKLE